MTFWIILVAVLLVNLYIGVTLELARLLRHQGYTTKDSFKHAVRWPLDVW